MTSQSSRPTRRRQRSTRLVIACVLLAAAGVLVAGAALSGSWLIVTIAAGLGVALGATATRIAHIELLDSRREAARDRAALAQDYRALAETRNAEHAVYVGAIDGQIARGEATISRLEGRLADAAAEVIATRRRLAEETERTELAEVDGRRLTARLEDADERAAHAIVRVAELEHELDVVTAEWQAGQVA
ncbi:MAG: hypothetical protein WKF79_04925, partial [Nocardioides sp.]